MRGAVRGRNMKHLLQLMRNSKNMSTYLVVDHHVDCAVCGVGGQVRQVEGLVHDPLACEGSIAVQQDGHHLCNHSTFYKHLPHKRGERVRLPPALPSCPLCLHSRTAPLWSFPGPPGPRPPGGTGSP